MVIATHHVRAAGLNPCACHFNRKNGVSASVTDGLIATANAGRHSAEQNDSAMQQAAAVISTNNRIRVGLLGEVFP